MRMPPVVPPSARLPSGYRQQQQAPRLRSALIPTAKPAAYGPRLYYVLPPTDGQHVYYYVQPGYGYAQPGYAQPQYYQLYGQY